MKVNVIRPKPTARVVLGVSWLALIGPVAYRLDRLGVSTWIVASLIFGTGALLFVVLRVMRAYRIEYDDEEVRECARGKVVRRLRYAEITRVDLEERVGVKAQRELFLIVVDAASASLEVRMEDHDAADFTPLLRALRRENPRAQLNEPARSLCDASPVVAEQKPDSARSLRS